MKGKIKNILATAILAGWVCSLVWAGTYTTNYNLYKPSASETNWGDAINTNFDTIDTQMNTNATNIGAPDDINYLVGTADADLSAEIAVGTTPGGQLGGTWASPTIDDLFIQNSADDEMDANLTVTGRVTANVLEASSTGASTFSGHVVFASTTTFDGAVDMTDGSLEIPNSAAPTVDAAGELAYDNTISGLSDGALIYYDGDQTKYVVSLAVVPDTDDTVVTYDSTGDYFYMSTIGGGGGGGDITAVFSCGTGDCSDVTVEATDSLTIASGELITVTANTMGSPFIAATGDTMTGVLTFDKGDYIVITDHADQAPFASVTGDTFTGDVEITEAGSLTLAKGDDLVITAHAEQAQYAAVAGDTFIGDMRFNNKVVLTMGTTFDNDLVYRSYIDQITFTTDDTMGADTDHALFLIAGDSGNAGMVADAEIFEVGKGGTDETQGNYTELFSVDEDGDVNVVGNLSPGVLTLPSEAAPTVDAAGEIAHDNTITGLGDGAITFYDGDQQRYLVDLPVVPTVDGTVVTYEATGGYFYMSAAGAGDVTDVFDCGAGDCGTITAESGDTLTFAQGSTLTIAKGSDLVITDHKEQSPFILAAGDTMTGTLKFNDAVDLTFGTGDDNTIRYRNTESQLTFNTADTVGSDADYGLYLFAADTGNAGMTANAEIFEIGKGGSDESVVNYTELFAVDEDGDVAIAGGLGLRSAADPDLTVEGQLSWDNNEDLVRGYDGTNQVVLATKDVHVVAPIMSPSLLLDSTLTPIWINNSGNDFIITEVKSYSDTDNVDYTLKISNTTNFTGMADIHTFTVSTNGTGVFYDTVGAISGYSTVDPGDAIIFDEDTADSEDYLMIDIKGYFNADVN